jgi:predicted NBD/HSP70 family sugar kinase
VRIINDAAGQALGSYTGGVLVFLGLGTGLGAALVADGVVVAMELAHRSFRRGTYEDYLGAAALQRLGRKKWQRFAEVGTARMIEALDPDDVVLGGGNARNLKEVPAGCRRGDNGNAFIGGFRLWEREAAMRPRARTASRGRSRRAA